MTAEHTDSADVSRNTEVVLRFMRLMDDHDFDALDEVLAPDLKFQIGAAVLDRQQLQDLIRVFYAAFPDLTHTPEEILSVGDRVVLRATDRATHNGGDFQGIAPTGRRVTFSQIAIYRIVAGRIANIWEEADLLGLMQQLGAASAMQL
jgi:ketosteroid isomerase-like protein